MQLLRVSSVLTRLVLAWFVLSLGVAMASPFVQPQTLELVCGADARVKLVALGDDGALPATDPATLDCPACLPALLPLSISAPTWPAAAPAELRPRKLGANPVVALLGAPLPPRGPPSAA